ncbi:glutathione S-transferase family protein [Legionella sp. 227]|uniref:glutathione S-transferase family protein n=1 Tax=Legionella sp. 227 TaxID=3367288 RepID=UPI00370D1470
MIKLYQFPSAWSLPNPSPFCMKLETYLRMAKLPFETVSVIDPRRAPKKKLPVISDDGRKIADSGFIIDYLQHKYGDPLDGHLTAAQKAEALAVRRMLEEHLYWVIVYSRWIDDRYWPTTKETFFGHLKQPLYYFVPKLIQRKIRQDLYRQGLGRHTTTEVYQLGIADLHALSILLEESDFFMGNEPTSIDACVYAFLKSIIQPPIPSPLQEYAQSHPCFLSYCERMTQMFYPER